MDNNIPICTRFLQVFATCGKHTHRHKGKLFVLAVLTLTVFSIFAFCSFSSSSSSSSASSSSSICPSFFHRGRASLTRALGRLFQPGRPSRGGQKMLIYVCRGSQGCAGWSDRQRSIVGMFLLALVTNRTFGILLTTPCDLSHFYRPNRYDWRVEESEVESRSPRLIYPADNLSRIDFNRQYPEDVLYARVNSECFKRIRSNPRFRAHLPAWAKMGYGRYFHAGWNLLMKPAPGVQRRVDTVLEALRYHNRTQPLVCVHLRMGRNPSNPKERHSFYKVSELEPLWRRVAPFVKNGSQVFVASDSGEVRNVSKGRFGESHHDSGGVIVHVGKQREDSTACRGFRDALVDQLVLSYCDVLFMSRGGFAYRASLMGHRTKQLYIFSNGKVTP